MSDGATVGEIERALGAERAGPAMWGEIYRSRRNGTYLRVIPNRTGDLNAQRRNELNEWPSLSPEAGLAPVLRVDQRGLLGDQWFQCVEYAIDGEPLARVLAGGSPEYRATAAGRVLQALPAWWRALDDGLLPMAADIVLVDDEPWLLRMPRWGMPGPAALLDEPSRALHLAPELVRGRATPPDRTSDLFAVGAALLGFAYLPESQHGATVLQRMAAATAFDPGHRVERLSPWTAQVPAIGRGVAALTRLVATDPAQRTATGLDELADRLFDCAEALNPATSVRRVQDERGNDAALALVREALRDEASYDLYLLAADLSASPLSALTFLDEAVRADPSRAEAYAAQFRFIARLHGAIIMLLSRIDSSFTERLDRIMTEAFEHFDADEQDAQLPAMADYLVARGKPGAATRLLRPALVDDDGKKLWWKFGHTLAFARALLEAGHCPTAGKFAANIRSDLDRVRRNHTVSPSAIGRYGLELQALETAIDRRCRDGS